MNTCVFCEIAAGETDTPIVASWEDAVAFEPLHPVTPGHLLVVPKRHVADATENPDVTAAVMRAAAELATPPCNLITSCGPEATQTVYHLHVHVVPRRTGDGLHLPWTGRDDARAERATIVAKIRSLVVEDEWGLFTAWRDFVRRAPRLTHGESPIAVLHALADEIEQEGPRHDR